MDVSRVMCETHSTIMIRCEHKRDWRWTAGHHHVHVDIGACSPPGPIFQSLNSSRGNLTFHCRFEHSRWVRTGCSLRRKAKHYKQSVRVPIPSRRYQWIKSFGLHQAPAVHICNSHSTLSPLSPCPCFDMNMFVATSARVCMWNTKIYAGSAIITPNFKTEPCRTRRESAQTADSEANVVTV